jgi:ftsJ-like methyltransferase
MKIKKIFLGIFLFACFLVAGVLVSNIQSISADQVLTASGLSSYSRNLKTNSKVEIRTLLKYLTKKYPNEKITLELNNKYDQDQVLIWSNYQNELLPVAKGRYFNPEEFEGVVSFGIVSPTSNIQLLNTQDNKYIVLNNRYISVVGTLKEVSDNIQTKYYLTTGINQGNSKARLNNFDIIIDTPSNRVVQGVSKYLNGQVTFSELVSTHRRTHFIRAMAFSILLGIIVLFAGLVAGACAIINHIHSQMDKIERPLKKYFIASKLGRFVFINILMGLAAYFFLTWRLYFTSLSYLIIFFVLMMTLNVVIYMLVVFFLNRKEKLDKLVLPKEFKDKYQKLLAKKADSFFTALEAEPKKAFRLNPLKADYQEVSYDLSKPVDGVADAYYGEISGRDIEWVSGYVYSQDPSAMYPAEALGVKPGQKVLDLCAAPGGKSTALLSALKNKGLLVANEISTSRAKNLRENIERWGADNCLVTNEDTSHLAQKFPRFFDAILVDAPCSGEGMFRKNHDAVTYWSQEYVLECSNRQKEILNEAVKMLKPGGSLLYSTCTYAPEEDEEICAYLVNELGFKLVETKVSVASQGVPAWGENLDGIEYARRFWPEDEIGEGQFLAKFILPEINNEEAVTNSKQKSKKRGKKANKRLEVFTKAEKELVQELLADFNLPNNFDFSKAVKSKDHVYIPAVEDVSQIKVLNNGLELGVLKKGRFEPSQQLAQYLGQVRQEKVVELQNQAEFEKYLHGETVRTEAKLKGFVLISYQDKIFSFGKVTGQVVKNFYPKGLRI